MIYRGKAFCFGDDITTDYISPGRYKYESVSMREYATHMMEDIRPGFFGEFSSGDIIVAGKNFGCGSSRESAALVIRESGIAMVLAKSFARIFYRNAISTGLLLFECDTDGIREGDLLEVDPGAGTIYTPRGEIRCDPMPQGLLTAMMSGGMAANFKKHKSFQL